MEVVGGAYVKLCRSTGLIEGWYSSQGFIGYQACAIIAQHWLVDKACTMSGEDAIRNGWELKTDGEELTDIQLSQITELDKKLHIKENLAELNRFKNIFGIRVFNLRNRKSR